MGIIVDQFEVIDRKSIDLIYFGIDFHLRSRSRAATELLFGLLNMVGVQMEIAEGVNKFLGLESTNLGHHPREQCVRGDIKGHP